MGAAASTGGAAAGGVANGTGSSLGGAVADKGARPTVAAGAAPAASAAAATQGAQLTVKVALDPKLTSHVAPADTVFVYARAASGPPLPLAIQRLRVDQLPTTVVLTDGMGM